MPTTDDSVKGADLMVSRIFEEGKNVKIKGTTAVFGMKKGLYITLAFIIIGTVVIDLVPTGYSFDMKGKIIFSSFMGLSILLGSLQVFIQKYYIDSEKISFRNYLGRKTDILWKDISSVELIVPPKRFSDKTYFINIYRSDGKFITIPSRGPVFPYMEEFFRKYYPEAFKGTAQEQ